MHHLHDNVKILNYNTIKSATVTSKSNSDREGNIEHIVQQPAQNHTL